MAITTGLIGLMGAGRSTLLDLVSGGSTFAAERTGRFTARAALVSPADARLDWLTEFYAARKSVLPEFTYVDYDAVGLGEGGGREAEWLNALQPVDVLAAVLPVFLDEGAEDSVARRLAEVSADLVLADLSVVENRLERLAHDLERAPKVDRPALESEREVLAGLRAALEDGTHLRALEWDEARRTLVRSFGFMTMKPMVVVLNTGEDEAAGWAAACDRVRELWPFPGTGVMACSAAIEAEAGELGEDGGEILEALGIEGAASARLAEAVVEAAGLIPIYTGSESEARAWLARRGASALDFAGMIHSDLARGFIRAEVIALDLLDAAGSEAEARRLGQIRSEGKEYRLVPDELVHVLFSR
jgi:ribosome-binding ATPase